jgi:hypothetical protein
VPDFLLRKIISTVMQNFRSCYYLLSLALLFSPACRKDMPESLLSASQTCTDCLESKGHLFIRQSNAAVGERDGENEIGNRKILLGAQRANHSLWQP